MATKAANQTDRQLTREAFNPEPLRHARRVRGLTLTELARMAERSLPTISETLNGNTAGVKTVAVLAEILGVDVARCYKSKPKKARRPEK